ncbi:MAG: CHAT domain-containing protein [Oscillatoria sp. SIO1A7]|nr:CHAT domain-containing protein [Oscillatoria sp. SIO1A7]
MRKWLKQIAISLLTALLVAKTSLAVDRSLIRDLGTGGEGDLGTWGQVSLPRSPSPPVSRSPSPLLPQSPGLPVPFSPGLPVSQSPGLPVPWSPSPLLEGRQLFIEERFSEAVEIWERAAEAFQESGSELSRAIALNYLCLAYQKLGQWDRAKKAIEESLSLLEMGQNTLAANYPSVLGAVLNTRGRLELSLGKSIEALDTWKQAAANYRQGQDSQGAIGAEINQAEALATLGLYSQAQKTLERIEQQLENQPSSLVKATGLRSIGNALRRMGDLEKSLAILQESLNIARRFHSRAAISAAHFSLGNTAVALAKKAEDLGDKKRQAAARQSALDYYQQAVERSESPMMRIRASLNRLSLFTNIKQFDRARELASAIQPELLNLPPSRQKVYAQINFAGSLRELENNLNTESNLNFHKSRSLTLTSVAFCLATAVRDAKNIGDMRAYSYALGNLGELYESTEQWEEAERLTNQALLEAQSINAADIAYRWQWQLGRILQVKGKMKEATAAYRVAVETLATLRNELAGISTDIQFDFRESVEPVYRELVGLLLAKSEGIETGQENLQEARQLIESLQLAEIDNFFQEACLDTMPVAIDRIDSQAASIYPIILEDRLEVILALPGSELRQYTTVISKKKVEKVLSQLRRDLGRITPSKQKIVRLSQQVYDWIIRPAAKEIEESGVETLAFVLDGLLRNIPMAALHDGEGYLIEKYSIALTPGLQLLNPQPLAPEDRTVLAAGLSEARAGFSALPNVIREIEEIEEIEEIGASRVLLNEEFTGDALRKELNQFPFPVIHIATHGQFSSQAENTFILAYDRKINVKELDALLRNRQEEGGNPIELLVFSACETARGDDRAALGLAGVAVRAGARSTLATLWQVSDRSTAELMAEFYRQLAVANTSKALALRRAQLSIMKQRRYGIPYFWAPYVLVGSWL